MKKFTILTLVVFLIIGLCSCDPYADEFNRMQSEINSLKERVERNEESIDILIANTNTEVEHLRDYIENVSIISDGQNEEVLEKIESLSTVLETLKKNVSDTDEDRIAEIEALEDELDALKERVERNEESIASLESLTSRISALETKVTNLGNSEEDIIKRVADLEEIVEDYRYEIDCLEDDLDSMYTTLGTNILTVKESILSRVHDDEENLKKIADDLYAKVKDNADLLDEVGEDLEAIYEKIGLLDIRFDEHYHINPTMNDIEPHTWGDWLSTETYHYHECSVCGFKGSYSEHHWTTDITASTCHKYCKDCEYSARGEIPHEWKYEAKGTTEEEFRENYPTSLNAYGTIYKLGSYDRVCFTGVPNLYRSEDNRVECSNCRTITFKVMDRGDGTGYYQLDYYPELDIEKYVTEADEYMLRLSDIEGTRVLFLRNYYVTRTVEVGSDVTVYKWAVEDGKLNYYKDGILKNTVNEITGSEPLADFVDWDGGHSWNNNGYAVGGEIYFMSFNPNHREEYDFYETVSFKAVEGELVEVESVDLIYTKTK